jgi:ABC-2 type transport system ATP-binding protein
VLQVCQLCKRFGDRIVLNHLSFHIRPGEVYGLLGPNGAGKTTTINVLCNLVHPDSGLAFIANDLISEESKALIGVAPQENLLYRTLTCAENLHFFARIYGLSQLKRIEQVYHCLEVVNLLDRADSPVETLSGGMQRRLSVAIALVHQPKLVILDEPTTGLDIESRYEIWALITKLKQQGITVLLTTHLLEEAERLCQRIGILKKGQLLAEGTLAELKKWIKAEAIAVMQTDEVETAIAHAEQLGFIHRYYGSDLAFWLPKSMELRELLQQFEPIHLQSLAIQPIRLEHIYLEVTRELNENSIQKQF